MIKKFGIYVFLLLLTLSSCNTEEVQDNKLKRIDKKQAKKHLERVNKYLVKDEVQNIKDFISRRGFDMKETGSGLYYDIYHTTDGIKAEKGKIAKLKYKVYLLDGELVYSSENDGLKEFLIGKGGVESGLEEGILLMKKGEKARFIIPSHLAYGLLGDLERIPTKSTIVYDLELLNLLDKSKTE